MSSPFTTCLWFDGQAEEAAKHYTTIFKNSKILETHRYPEAGQEIHGQKPGSVMTITFEINGQRFMGLNGGPQFKFSEAVSLMVHCDDQAEVDNYVCKSPHELLFSLAPPPLPAFQLYEAGRGNKCHLRIMSFFSFFDCLPICRLPKTVLC